MTTRTLGFSVLLKAVYTRLTTHANTSAYTFYNAVPDNASMPYIVITNPMGVRAPTLSCDDIAGEANVFHLHIWTPPTSEGDKAVGDIMNNCAQALSSSALSITGYTDVLKPQLEFAEIVKDDTVASSPVWHGIMRFRVTMA